MAGKKASTPTKRFRISAEDIQPLAEGRGACFASDLITVDGQPVGFMYRESPDNKLDSGWRFLAGTESQEYLENPDNLAIYDVNTIANYDRSIIPLLDSPPGSAFERATGTEQFVAVHPSWLEDVPDDDGDEPPPLVKGEVVIADAWTISLTEPFRRRADDGCLALWRPGLTAWIALWPNSGRRTMKQRLAELQGDTPPAARDKLIDERSRPPRYSYRLPEKAPGRRLPAFHGFVLGQAAYAQIIAHFDDEKDLATAHALWRGLVERQ